MKRAYKKPEIMFEDFSLSVNIASCEVSTNFARNVCTYEVPGIGNVFNTGMALCDGFPVDKDGAYNGICYHVPIEDKQLFAS